MRPISVQGAWFLVLGLSAVLVVMYMSMYQTQQDRWGRLVRDLPVSADDIMSSMKDHVPDDVMLSLQSWGAKVEETKPAVDPWDSEQQRRKDFINKVCYQVREAAEVTRPSPKELLQYMVLDNADQVLFCPSLEDAAATDWQRVLEEYAERALRLEKYARGEDSWESARDEQVDRRRAQDQGLVEEGRDHRDKFRDVINAKSVQEVLSSYYMKANTKVLLVEHPFERLLSFYLETIRDKVGKTGESISKKIINHSYKRESNKSKKTKQATFTQFIKYLLFRVAFDPHLKALYYICHPCDIQYDYIVKMETFHEDIRNINRRLGLAHEEDFADGPPPPPREEFTHFNLTDETWIQEILYDKYSKIDSDSLLKAFDLFSIDMFLFNYSWPFKNLSLTKKREV